MSICSVRGNTAFIVKFKQNSGREIFITVKSQAYAYMFKVLKIDHISEVFFIITIKKILNPNRFMRCKKKLKY